jgi:hypothetical protein
MRDMGPANVSTPDDAEYLAFEAVHLPALEAAAKGGLTLLQETFAKVPQGAHKAAMWKAHSAALKQAAADSAIIEAQVDEVPE